MAIISLNTNTTGLVGDQVNPRRVTMVTTDSLATITTAGYMNGAAYEGFFLLPTDILDVWYSYVSGANPGTYGEFYPTTSSGSITLNVANSSVSKTTSLAAPGTIRAFVGSITETATTMTSGNIVGVRGVATLKGASGGFIYGVQGKVISTGTLSGSSWTAPVFGQVDISAATVNAGQIAPIWGDYGSTSGTISDATGMRMFAGTNTTAATLNAMIYLYGKTSNLFELDANGSTYISTGGATASGTIKKIAILIEGVQYYLQAATVYS